MGTVVTKVMPPVASSPLSYQNTLRGYDADFSTDSLLTRRCPHQDTIVRYSRTLRTRIPLCSRSCRRAIPIIYHLRSHSFCNDPPTAEQSPSSFLRPFILSPSFQIFPLSPQIPYTSNYEPASDSPSSTPLKWQLRC